jgi:N-acetylglucosaminyl-diphospho-decaprenol L-rhamnosyltransferase
MSRVSIVVPTVLGGELLRSCLESVRRQEAAGLETVVVVDGDGAELDSIREEFPGVLLVANDGPRGFAAAANTGARAASGDVLAFLNDDVELDVGWLREVLACLERHPRAAAATGKVVRADDRGVLDGAGDALSASLKAYRRGQGTRDDGRFDREEEVFSASGTACVWRAEGFRSLGGYDAAFVAYYEDVDLGFRARRAGLECWYTPAALASHRGSATTRERWRDFESFWSVRNRWAMIVKNVPLRWLLPRLPLLAAAEGATLLRAALTGSLAPHLRAYADVVANREALLAQRRSLPSAPGARATRLVRGWFPPVRTSAWRFRATLRLRRAERGAGS